MFSSTIPGREPASVPLVKAIAGDGSVCGSLATRGNRSTAFAAPPPSTWRVSRKNCFQQPTSISSGSVTARPSRSSMRHGLREGMGASKDMLALKSTRSRPRAGGPDLRKFDRDEDEEEGIAAAIREFEANGVGLRDQAVLCRSNRRLNEIAAALETRTFRFCTSEPVRARRNPRPLGVDESSRRSIWRCARPRRSLAALRHSASGHSRLLFTCA